MKPIILRYLTIILIAAFWGTAKLRANELTVIGESTKLSYDYSETMAFSFFLQPAPVKPLNHYRLRIERSGDDGQTTTEIVGFTSENRAVFRTSMAQSGFVRIIAYLIDENGGNIERMIKERVQPIRFEGGAGVAIHTLKQATPEPADFDAFWTRQKERLKTVPIKSRLKEVKNDPKGKIYAVSVDCFDSTNVTGYLTIPANAKEKSLAATVSFVGYGYGAQAMPTQVEGDRLRLVINAHGYELGNDDAYYTDYASKTKSNGKDYAFDPVQNSDPEKAYFNGMAMRVMRALEFVKSLPEWNGKELLADGGSQGGLQAIWAGALDSEVTAVRPNVPWCCDLNGKAVGRIGGWAPPFVVALGYYDAVNHAKRIRCPVTINWAGLGDYICPPSGVAVLYNNIVEPKKITWLQGSTHGYSNWKDQKFVLENKNESLHKN